MSFTFANFCASQLNLLLIKQHRYQPFSQDLKGGKLLPALQEVSLFKLQNF